MGAAKSIPWDEQSAAQRKRTLAALVLAHHDADLPGVHLPHIFLAEAEEALSPFGWPNVDALRARLGLS